MYLVQGSSQLGAYCRDGSHDIRCRGWGSISGSHWNPNLGETLDWLEGTSTGKHQSLGFSGKSQWILGLNEPSAIFHIFVDVEGCGRMWLDGCLMDRWSSTHSPRNHGHINQALRVHCQNMGKLWQAGIQRSKVMFPEMWVASKHGFLYGDQWREHWLFIIRNAEFQPERLEAGSCFCCLEASICSGWKRQLFCALAHQKLSVWKTCVSISVLLFQSHQHEMKSLMMLRS